MATYVSLRKDERLNRNAWGVIMYHLVSVTYRKRLVAVALACLTVCVCSLQMYGVDEVIIRTKTLQSRSCQYSGSFCNWSLFILGHSYVHERDVTCRFIIQSWPIYVPDEPGALLAAYECIVYKDGCCTMPTNADCPPSECPSSHDETNP